MTRLRSLRQAAGLSQGEMAAALGLELETYRKYETRSLPPMRLIERLCIVTHTSCDFLMFGHTSQLEREIRRRTAKRTKAAEPVRLAQRRRGEQAVAE